MNRVEQEQFEREVALALGHSSVEEWKLWAKKTQLEEARKKEVEKREEIEERKSKRSLHSPNGQHDYVTSRLYAELRSILSWISTLEDEVEDAQEDVIALLVEN